MSRLLSLLMSAKLSPTCKRWFWHHVTALKTMVLLTDVKQGKKSAINLNILRLSFFNAVILCQWTHRDMQLRDSLQHKSLDAGDALLSRSEKGVDSAQLRSQATLTGPVNRCSMYCLKAKGNFCS